MPRATTRTRKLSFNNTITPQERQAADDGALECRCGACGEGGAWLEVTQHQRTCHSATTHLPQSNAPWAKTPQGKWRCVTPLCPCAKEKHFSSKCNLSRHLGEQHLGDRRITELPCDFLPGLEVL